MKFLAILVLLSALGIAGCAAYFSVIGLKLLFVGGGLSIVIMGTALEVGKIVTVTFLHQMWDKISRSLKAYLIVATALLVIITSIGIYGYLSAGYNATSVKVAEYERQIQTNLQRISAIETENENLSNAVFNVTEIEQINTNREAFIQQRLNLISQREQQIVALRNNSRSFSNTEDLSAAKNALDTAKSSVDTEVERELQQINIYNNRLVILDAEVQTWLDQGRGNIFRQNGIEKARQVRKDQESDREQIENQIKNSQQRIDTLRNQYTAQVREYNDRVASIEKRTSTQNQTLENNIQNIQAEINSLITAIENYNEQVDANISKLNRSAEEVRLQNKNVTIKNQTLVDQLFLRNSELQQNTIKTDVGTFKFIARSLGLELDNTVNYFIWLIMIVFDPLAVALILCFNYLIGHNSKTKEEKIIEKIEQDDYIVVQTTTPEPVVEVVSDTIEEKIVETSTTTPPTIEETLQKPAKPADIKNVVEETPSNLRDSEMYHTPRKPV
jgi:hypothetical protein